MICWLAPPPVSIKILKFQTQKNCRNCPKNWFYHRLMCPNSAYRMANSRDRDRLLLEQSDTSLVTRKPVFGICDHIRLKPACSATETSWGLEVLAIAGRGIILFRQRTAKVLIRLRGCAGWSAPLLFAYGINTFSHDVAHMGLHWLPSHVCPKTYDHYGT